MHEASLVMALFDQADDAIAPHEPGRVTRVEVRLGDRAGVEPELFLLAFQGLREDRGYGSAALSLRHGPGRELILERIELEVEDV